MPIYHDIPPNMKGNTLYPLNRLKDIYPDIYKEEAAKYAGREEVMRVEIPELDCLWNDVLHFSSIPPQKLLEALNNIGFDYDPQPYLELDLAELEKGRWLIYHDPIDGEEVKTTDPEYLRQHDEIPQAVLDYFQECYDNGIHPLIFHGLPHVLYKGSIIVKDQNRKN